LRHQDHSPCGLGGPYVACGQAIGPRS
jgi:hypothetical protein